METSRHRRHILSERAESTVGHGALLTRTVRKFTPPPQRSHGLVRGVCFCPTNISAPQRGTSFCSVLCSRGLGGHGPQRAPRDRCFTGLVGEDNPSRCTRGGPGAQGDHRGVPKSGCRRDGSQEKVVLDHVLGRQHRNPRSCESRGQGREEQGQRRGCGTANCSV